MKSESTHYQKPSEKKPDLLESISMLEAEIEAHEAEEKAHHDLAVSKRSKLRSFLLLQKKYDDLLNEVSEGIIADEASGFNGEANQNTADKRPSTERRGL